jgi:glycosyltransferase involved in cell wall biosynthesis
MDRRHGTERAVVELVERLARDYHCEVHLYSQRVEDLVVDLPDTARTNNSGAIFWHRVPSLEGPHLVRFVGWLVANSVLRWFHGRFQGTPVDLVISPGINALDADFVMVHVLFHRLQDISREKNATAGGGAGFFHRLHRRAYYGLLAALERRVYHDPKVILSCVSRRTSDLLDRYFQRQDVRVIPNGVDAGHFSPAARLARRARARCNRNFQGNDFVLLLVGNDWGVKGVPTILAAMAALPTLPLHLVVAGTDDVESFRKMAGRLNLSSRFHREPPQDDVMDFYATADLYVSPSREDSFGLPVLEAMACGLPVITSKFAGVSELITHEVNGLVLCDPQAPQALARLLERVFMDESLRKRIAEAGAITAQQWTWDRNAIEMWELLKRAAERKRQLVLSSELR